MAQASTPGERVGCEGEGETHSNRRGTRTTRMRDPTISPVGDHRRGMSANHWGIEKVHMNTEERLSTEMLKLP